MATGFPRCVGEAQPRQECSINPHGKPDFYDNEFQNGSTYYYTRGGSCKVIDMGVGLLPPNWLQGANYRGMETVIPRDGGRGRLCHVWDKGDAMGNATGPFIVYYEDSETGRPFHWRFFSGLEFDVVQWIPGGMASEKTWQLPSSCLEASGALEEVPQHGAAERISPEMALLHALSRSPPAGNNADDVCKGHRCDTAACPCGCECGTKDNPGLCYVPEPSLAARHADIAGLDTIVV